MTCSIVLICALAMALPAWGEQLRLSDAQIAGEMLDKNNQVIIEEFLKRELTEVNEFATKPLLARHPSLIFFIKQVEKGPMSSLLFLEDQVHKLREAQKDIDSVAMMIAFSEDERKKLMGLKPVADRIISYGIPLMKRDFYRVLVAAKALASQKRKHPMELLPDPSFRDAIYREVEPDPKALDKELGELSFGESECMKLGWTLQTITVTSLWLSVTDNTLPDKRDFDVYRKKRSEYFQKRLKRIYGEEAVKKAFDGAKPAR